MRSNVPSVDIVSRSFSRLIDALTVLKLVSMPPSQRWSTYGMPRALRFLGDDLARLPLGADEQDRAAVRGQLADVLHRIVVLLERALEVDDVDLVALAEDELGHLRVPVPRLVAEMDAGLQHLTHRDGHCRLLSGLVSTTRGDIR